VIVLVIYSLPLSLLINPYYRFSLYTEYYIPFDYVYNDSALGLRLRSPLGYILAGRHSWTAIWVGNCSKDTLNSTGDVGYHDNVILSSWELMRPEERLEMLRITDSALQGGVSKQAVIFDCRVNEWFCTRGTIAGAWLDSRIWPITYKYVWEGHALKGIDYHQFQSIYQSIKLAFFTRLIWW